jgi:hypothetical protein
VADLLGLWVQISPGTWISASCECCVLSGRGLLWLITHSEESYCIWCVQVWSWSLDNVEALACYGLFCNGEWPQREALVFSCVTRLQVLVCIGILTYRKKDLSSLDNTKYSIVSYVALIDFQSDLRRSVCTALHTVKGNLLPFWYFYQYHLCAQQTPWFAAIILVCSSFQLTMSFLCCQSLQCKLVKHSLGKATNWITKESWFYYWQGQGIFFLFRTFTPTEVHSQPPI